MRYDVSFERLLHWLEGMLSIKKLCSLEIIKTALLNNWIPTSNDLKAYDEILVKELNNPKNWAYELWDTLKADGWTIDAAINLYMLPHLPIWIRVSKPDDYVANISYGTNYVDNDGISYCPSEHTYLWDASVGGECRSVELNVGIHINISVLPAHKYLYTGVPYPADIPTNFDIMGYKGGLDNVIDEYQVFTAPAEDVAERWSRYTDALVNVCGLAVGSPGYNLCMAFASKTWGQRGCPGDSLMWHSNPNPMTRTDIFYCEHASKQVFKESTVGLKADDWFGWPMYNV